jgi:hypothetical protein
LKEKGVEKVAEVVVESPVAVADISVSSFKVEALKVYLPDDPQDQFLCEGCQ